MSSSKAANRRESSIVLLDAELNKLLDLWREFGKNIDSRNVDSMNTILVTMRAHHGMMEVMRVRMAREIDEAANPDSERLFEISIATTKCKNALSRIEDCENTWNDVILDVGSREVPIVGEGSGDESDDELSEDEVDATGARAAARGKPVIILYKMEGCGACIDFKPIWDRFVKALRAHEQLGGAVASGIIVREQHPELCRKAGVNAFPTVRMMQMVNDRPVVDEYQGGSSVPSLMNFVQKSLGRSS
jgi:thiol-disulfide isomerase/thioredoxin